MTLYQSRVEDSESELIRVPDKIDKALEKAA